MIVQSTKATVMLMTGDPTPRQGKRNDGTARAPDTSGGIGAANRRTVLVPARRWTTPAERAAGAPKEIVGEHVEIDDAFFEDALRAEATNTLRIVKPPTKPADEKPAKSGDKMDRKG